MTIILKVSTFDVKSFQELLLQLALQKNKKKIIVQSSFIFPLKKIKKTILRATHGDKKTGQESVEITIYTTSFYITFFDLKSFLQVSNLFLKNCFNISYSLLKKK